MDENAISIRGLRRQYPGVALVLGAWCVIGVVLCLTTFRWRRGQGG